MQKLETSSKFMKWQIPRGNAFTKVKKIMKCFTTESLYARSTFSPTKYQKSSDTEEHWRTSSQATLITDTSPGSGNPKAGEVPRWGSVLGITILYLPSEVLTHLPCHRLHLLTTLEFALPKMAIPSSQKLLTRIKVRFDSHFQSGRVTAHFIQHLSL